MGPEEQRQNYTLFGKKREITKDSARLKKQRTTTHFFEATVTLITKLDRSNTRKELMLTSFMNIDVNIINEILSNHICVEIMTNTCKNTLKLSM